MQNNQINTSQSSIINPQSSNNIAIKVKNLTKVYKLYEKPIDRLKESLNPFRRKYHREFYALKDVSFEVKKGETVGIIGRNGSGKSTLLKIITGVLKPSCGRVDIYGKISAILELGSGMNPEMNGIENIYLNSAINGLTKEEIDEKIDNIIEFSELGDFIRQPIKMYSSGMRARLAFAIAINVEPDILIVDEALAVGDLNFQAKCMTAMKKIQESGATVLFVSHSIDSIRSLCQKTIYLKQGKMIKYGATKDVTELYMKELHKEQNKQSQSLQSVVSKKAEILTTTPNRTLFKRSKVFDERVKFYRHGTGEAKITYVELVNSKNQIAKKVEFNEEVKIRIYFESYTNIPITVNFQIQDANKINIICGGFRQSGKDFVSNTKGNRFIVEYSLKLPLQNGNYSILASIRASIVLNKVGKVIDYIPDAYVFQVKTPKVKRWCKVDLFPKLQITKT